MHIGQNCKVRWQTQQDSDTFIWHNAMIKSIEGDTITVIWENGQWEGHESDRIPLDWVIVRDNIKTVKRDIDDVKQMLINHMDNSTADRNKLLNILRGQNEILMQTLQKSNNIGFKMLHEDFQRCRNLSKRMGEKMDGITSLLDRLNTNLERSHTMQNIFDDDEVNYDMERLKESLNSLGSVHMYSGDENEKRLSPELPVFGRYSRDNNKD